MTRGWPNFSAGAGWPVGGLRGLDEIGELRRRQATVVGERFGLEDAAVDVIAQGAEVAQVRQPPSDAEVIGIVEGGLGAQGALLLEILLDPTVLVGDVHAGVDACGDDVGA